MSVCCVCVLLSHQSELWDGSAQRPLLAVGDIHWRETDRDKPSADEVETHGAGFIIFIMRSKKSSRHIGLWESHKSHSCWLQPLAARTRMSWQVSLMNVTFKAQRGVQQGTATPVITHFTSHVL